MGKIKRVGDLEIDQDLRYQRRAWLTERIGWVCMALIVLAAILGFLGPGLLGRRTLTDGSGALTVEYTKFLRYEGPATLTFHLKEAAFSGGDVRLWISQDYLDSLQIVAVTPPPDHAEIAQGRVIYVFKLAPGTRQALITFDVTEQKIGPVRARVGTGEGQSLSFSQFIYP